MSEIGILGTLIVGTYVAPGGVAPPNPTGDPILDPFAASPLAGPVTDAAALAAGQEELGGLGDTPSDRIYERILIKPEVVDVGFVTDEVQRTGIIWNTHRALTATLSQILSTGDQGITLAGIAPLDVLLELLDVEFTYTVVTTGPISINALFRFLFDLGEARQTLIGSRGVIILTRPLARGYSEAWAYETKLFRSTSGVEYAKSAFAEGDPPRVTITFPISTLSRRDLARLENVLRFGGRYPVGVPLWMSMSRLAANTDGTDEIAVPTAERRFSVGDNVLLLSRYSPRIETFALRLIDEISENALVLNAPIDADVFEAGDFVVPLKEVVIPRNYDLVMQGARYARGSLSFTELR